MRYAARVNGATSMALTKLDVLDEIPNIKICLEYDFQGEFHDHPMANISHLKHCEPRYETMPGWEGDIGHCRSWDQLPSACRAYVTRLEEICGVSIALIGVGPRREQFVSRGREFFPAGARRASPSASPTKP